MSRADYTRTCEGCEHVVFEKWAKDKLAYRCFAPGRKECIERAKQMHTSIEKIHKEMWDAVKDRNGDAFVALSQEFERSAARLAEEWAQTTALAKIAVISEEG